MQVGRGELGAGTERGALALELGIMSVRKAGVQRKLDKLLLRMGMGSQRYSGLAFLGRRKRQRQPKRSERFHEQVHALICSAILYDMAVGVSASMRCVDDTLAYIYICVLGLAFGIYRIPK